MRHPALVAILLFATSCATMVNGRYQEVKVDSFPGRAAIQVDCGDTPRDAGFTPAVVKLQRGANYCHMTLSKEGYQPRTVVFGRQLSRAVTANRVAGAPLAVLGGLFGFILSDELGASEALAGQAWDVGLDIGAAPGSAYDKRTGGAYKWVPGDVFITLLRQEPAP